ncbi:MAG: lamin tail domain-containing protein [Bacteroidota bacterium]
MKKSFFILAIIVMGTACKTLYSQTYFDLSLGTFIENWSNTGMITANDDWSGVANIRGFLGSSLTTATGVDPQTVLADETTIDVIANQANPNTLTSGGVAEFEITDPVVAIQGSGTADAPFIVIFLNSTNVSNISITYNLRDVDGAIDNAVQPAALQYRIGTTGDFTNIPAGFVADASTGPSLATLVTPVNITLPGACENQAQLQIRIITANATGSDEWIGIDDINISGTTAAAPSKLLVTSINNGADPYVNTGFYAVVKAVDAGNNPVTVSSDVNYTYTRIAGTGVPGGTLSGTITTGTGVDTLFGITYNTVENGVSIKASDDASVLTADTSVLFNVIALPPVATKLHFTDINGGIPFYTNQSFTATVEILDNIGNPTNTVSDVNITLTRLNGTGTITGSTTGTITSGNSSTTISGIFYDVAETGVTLKVTDDAVLLEADTSEAFEVLSLPPAPALVITEIMYNPPESGTDSLEFIEIYNNGSTPADPDNLYFSSGVIYPFHNDIIQPGEYFILSVDSVAFMNFFGKTAHQWISGGLSNSGEAIVIKDGWGTVVDSVYYVNIAPWPTEPNGNGSSLMLCDPNTDNNSGSNWVASLVTNATAYAVLNTKQVYATPDTSCVINIVDLIPPAVTNAYATSLTDVTVVFDEAVNATAENTANYTGLISISTAIRNASLDTVTLTLATPLQNGVPDTLTISNVEDTSGNVMAAPQSFAVIFNVSVENIVITEIMYNDPSSGADSLEYIELYNNGTTAANISGYTFNSGITYEFPVNTIINPASYSVIAKNANAVNNFFTLSGTMQWDNGQVLNNTGEKISLVNMAGDIIDSLTYKISNPWPPAANGNGPSLTFCNTLLDNSNGSSWSASSEYVDSLNSAAVYGTPGYGCNAASPYVLNAYAFDNTTVIVAFNEAVNTTGENTVNYTGAGSVAGATRNAGLDTVTLSLGTALSDGIQYILAISGVQNSFAVPMDSTQHFPVMFNGSITEIIISEIMYNDPSLNDDSLEYVELYNNGAATANISGYSFNAGITYEFPLNTTINPSSYLVIAKNDTAVNNFYSISGTLQWDNGEALSNAGEKISIINMAGNVIDSLTYDVSSPWPASANGNGPSLTLCNPSLDNSDGNNWSASTEPAGTLNSVDVYGTPGNGCSIVTTPPFVTNAFVWDNATITVAFSEAVNATAEITSNYTGLGIISSAVRNTTLDTVTLSLATPLQQGVSDTLTVSSVEDMSNTPMAAPQDFIFIFNNTIESIVITEIMYNDPSLSADSLEFIEFYNNGAIANIGGYKITAGVLFQFPSGTTINNGGYIVVAKNAGAVDNFFGISGTLQWDNGEALSNAGEKIILTNTEGGIIDSLTYDISSPWPSDCNGNGPSLTLCNPDVENSDGSAWYPSEEWAGILNAIAVYAGPGIGCTTTGITEPALFSDLIISPNPSSSILNFINMPEQSEIIIFDVLGSMIKNISLQQDHVSVNISEFPKGIYIIHVNDKISGNTVSEKIVKL